MAATRLIKRVQFSISDVTGALELGSYLEVWQLRTCVKRVLFIVATSADEPSAADSSAVGRVGSILPCLGRVELWFEFLQEPLI